MPCRVGKVLAHLLHAGPGTLAIPCTQDEKLYSSPDERNWTQGRQKRGLSCPSHPRTPIIGAWHGPTRCPAKSRPQPCGCEPHLSKPGRGGGNPGPTPPQQQRTLRPEFPRPRSRPYNWSRTPKRRARRGAGRGPLRLRTPSGFGVPARSPRDLCLAQDGGNNQAWPGPPLQSAPLCDPFDHETGAHAHHIDPGSATGCRAGLAKASSQCPPQLPALSPQRSSHRWRLENPLYAPLTGIDNFGSQWGLELLQGGGQRRGLFVVPAEWGRLLGYCGAGLGPTDQWKGSWALGGGVEP